MSDVYSLNVKVIISNVYSLNVKVIISDVYSLNVKIIISNEPWVLALRCTTLDKGYSMLSGCQHWGSALGLPVTGWYLEAPLRLLCESEAEPVEAVGLWGEAEPWPT